MNLPYALSNSFSHSVMSISISLTIPMITRANSTSGLTSAFSTGSSRSASKLTPITSSLWTFFQPTNCRRAAENIPYNAKKGIRVWDYRLTSSRAFSHSPINPSSCSHLQQSRRFQSGYSAIASHSTSPHEPPLANSPPVVIPEKDGLKLASKLNPATSISDTRKSASTDTESQPQTSAKSRSRLRPSKAAISLAPDAVSRLRALLNGPTPQLIRIGVRNKGCAGMSYHLDYVESPGRFDEVVEQDGVKVLIDSKALFSIIGSEMDWKEDRLSSKFVFKNPNIKDACGCGESFTI